ncbi:hypothetical protein CY34DRAFT_19822 [Suillus luteus UH-Slu-Lm8-n1]|uniref:Uncharacterized protein n=1 Tax=Suillus luteus UH-Slu-Lm8-n1 TaxID=930992 RepID=A0A0C9Z270_9AGAM|nr:hypothetical protein CY34DRAFT_19822 [Suillus luteus UH-Slu-Lm8-n1]
MPRTSSSPHSRPRSACLGPISCPPTTTTPNLVLALSLTDCTLPALTLQPPLAVAPVPSAVSTLATLASWGHNLMQSPSESAGSIQVCSDPSFALTIISQMFCCNVSAPMGRRHFSHSLVTRPPLFGLLDNDIFPPVNTPDVHSMREREDRRASLTVPQKSHDIPMVDSRAAHAGPSYSRSWDSSSNTLPSFPRSQPQEKEVDLVDPERLLPERYRLRNVNLSRVLITHPSDHKATHNILFFRMVLPYGRCTRVRWYARNFFPTIMPVAVSPEDESTGREDKSQTQSDPPELPHPTEATQADDSS